MQCMPVAHRPEGQEVFLHQWRASLALQHISDGDRYGVEHLCRDAGRRDRREMDFTALLSHGALPWERFNGANCNLEITIVFQFQVVTAACASGP